MAKCTCGGCLNVVAWDNVAWDECQSCGAQWDTRDIAERGHLVITRQNLDMFQLLGETEGGLFQVRIDDVFEQIGIWRKKGKIWRKVCTLDVDETFDLNFDDEIVTFGFNEYRGGEGSAQIGIRAALEIQISRV
jgi:hypothetical protein